MATPILSVSKNQPAIQLGYCSPGQRIHMRVLNTNQILHFDNDRAALQAPVPVGGVAAGHQISSTDGMFEIEWNGPIYGIGDAANNADVQLSFQITSGSV